MEIEFYQDLMAGVSVSGMRPPVIFVAHSGLIWTMSLLSASSLIVYTLHPDLVTGQLEFGHWKMMRMMLSGIYDVMMSELLVRMS